MSLQGARNLEGGVGGGGSRMGVTREKECERTKGNERKGRIKQQAKVGVSRRGRKLLSAFFFAPAGQKVTA